MQIIIEMIRWTGLATWEFGRDREREEEGKGATRAALMEVASSFKARLWAAAESAVPTRKATCPTENLPSEKRPA